MNLISLTALKSISKEGPLIEFSSDQCDDSSKRKISMDAFLYAEPKLFFGHPYHLDFH